MNFSKQPPCLRHIIQPSAALLLPLQGRKAAFSKLSRRVVEAFKEEIVLRGAVGEQARLAHPLEVRPAPGTQLVAGIGQDVVAAAGAEVQAVGLADSLFQFAVGFQEDEESFHRVVNVRHKKRWFWMPCG